MLRADVPAPADTVAALAALLQLDSNPPVADVHSAKQTVKGREGLNVSVVVVVAAAVVVVVILLVVADAAVILAAIAV